MPNFGPTKHQLYMIVSNLYMANPVLCDHFSQDFKVLTVHKSTLRRGKKVKPCPDAKSGSEQGGGDMKVANDAE